MPLSKIIEDFYGNFWGNGPKILWKLIKYFRRAFQDKYIPWNHFSSPKKHNCRRFITKLDSIYKIAVKNDREEHEYLTKEQTTFAIGVYEVSKIANYFHSWFFSVKNNESFTKDHQGNMN